MIGNMLREAWQAMAANKLRTFLTMLGMVIGVGAVILMLAIGQGAQILVKQAIASMGSNLFIVLSGFSSTAGVRSGSGNAPTLTVRDARAMAELPSIEAVAPVQPGSSQVIYGSNNWNTQVYGTTPRYLDVRDWDIQSGAVFGDAEMRSATRVAILGQTVVQQLFGDEDP
jgi:putative ABC transport system permease protein